MYQGDLICFSALTLAPDEVFKSRQSILKKNESVTGKKPDGRKVGSKKAVVKTTTAFKIYAAKRWITCPPALDGRHLHPSGRLQGILFRWVQVLPERDI